MKLCALIRTAPVLLGLLPLMVASAGPASAAAPFDPFQAVDITGRPGDPLPMDAVFTDEAGRSVTLRELTAKRPILLAPVYYRCRNVCSVALSSAMNSLASVPLEPGRDFTFVAYSINPREGPADARKARRDALLRYGPDAEPGKFHFLTGSEGSVRALSEAIGFRFAWDEAISEYAHATALATVTADGRLARWIYGVSFSPLDLRLALLDAGEGAIGGLTDKLLLLCYRYDPETGRYGSLVRWIMMAGGLTTVLVLGSWIGFALWRERRGEQSRRAEP